MGLSALDQDQNTVFADRRIISARLRSRYAAACALLLAVVAHSVSAQSSSDAPESIHGTVVNRVTHEAIPGALVVSPDERFATLTDSQGRFQFTLPKPETPKLNSSAPPGGVQLVESNRPDMLTARKPGFLESENPEARLAQGAQDLTLSLVPESIISGQVSLPTSEAPDSIQLQLYRREVRDGRAHWVPAGTAISRSTGQFRFAGLREGTYKLLTRELIDRDPVTYDPGGQLYGYPPAYYQDAPDFDSASTIKLAAGETEEASISLVKQPYYNVKIAVENAPQGVGLNVGVYRQSRNGPGQARAYNAALQDIEGLLPTGTYTVEASGFGQTVASGLMTLTVKGEAVKGARMTLVSGSSIAVHVTEDFTGKEPEGNVTFNNGKRNFTVHGPRRYFNMGREAADDSGAGRNAFMGPPAGPDDDQLVIDNV